MQQIRDWLKRLGFEQYAHCFAENDIDFSIIHELTDQNLEEIGVHRPIFVASRSSFRSDSRQL
jgi:hypothetical protein